MPRQPDLDPPGVQQPVIRRDNNRLSAWKEISKMYRFLSSFLAMSFLTFPVLGQAIHHSDQVVSVSALPSSLRCLDCGADDPGNGPSQPPGGSGGGTGAIQEPKVLSSVSSRSKV